MRVKTNYSNGDCEFCERPYELRPATEEQTITGPARPVDLLTCCSLLQAPQPGETVPRGSEEPVHPAEPCTRRDAWPHTGKGTAIGRSEPCHRSSRDKHLTSSSFRLLPYGRDQTNALTLTSNTAETSTAKEPVESCYSAGRKKKTKPKERSKSHF